MPARERALVIAALIAATLTGGCGAAAQYRVPYLTRVREARKDVHGAQIKVLFGKGLIKDGPRPDVIGELLAANADSLWLLADHRLETIATGMLVYATIEVYEAPEPGWYQPPFARLYRPRPRECARLAQHARFPQGLPAGLDRSTLAPP